MTTLANRPNTALLVVDAQNGVVARACRRDAVLANIAAVVERARTDDAPIIWVQHVSKDLVKGEDAWCIVSELQPADDEPVIEKSYGDSFEETVLETLLADLSVGRLVVTGAQSDVCIRATIHGAFTRGYDVTLVGDAHTTEDLSQWGAPPPDQVIAHTNLYWKYQTAPGRTAGVAAAAEVGFK